MIFRNWPGQGTHTDIQWCETLQYRNFITDPIFRNQHLDFKLLEMGDDQMFCISIHYFSYKCIMCLMLFCSLQASFKSMCFFFTHDFVFFLYSQTRNFLAFVTFCFLHSYLSSFTSDFYEVEKNFGVNDIFRRPFETWNSEIKTLSCLRLHFHLYSWGMKKDFGVIDHQRGIARLRAQDKFQITMGWGRATGDVVVTTGI